MNTASKLLSASAVFALLAGGAIAHNGVDHDAAYAEIDGLTVTPGAGQLTVSGTLVYGTGEGPFVAFDDPAGDSTAPAQGLDITSGTIEQVDQLLIFTMNLSDLPLGEVQPGALYNWDLGVSGAGEQRLFAWRSNAVQSALGGGNPAEWSFSHVTFADGFLESPVVGQFTGSSLVWEVPVAQVGASGGSAISVGSGPMTASQGGLGALQLTGLVDYDTAAWSAGKFVVGGGVTLLLTGPDGYEEELRPRTRKDAFETAFTDLAPGAYQLTVTSGMADVAFEQVFDVTIA